MNVEITRGRSDIYDILTHLTFIFIESHKIRNRVLLDDAGEVSRDWFKLEQAVSQKKKLTLVEKERAISHAANILGRTFEEVLDIYDDFGSAAAPDRLLHVIFWLGKLAIEEIVDDNKRTITFSPILRERLGHHIHGEIWATNIKKVLEENQLLDRPIHVISANMHSVMNSIFATEVLKAKFKDKYEFPFPLLADEDKAVIQAFGVWGPKKFMGKEYDGIHRTTFVIDEKGIIEEVITDVKTKVHASQILK